MKSNQPDVTNEQKVTDVVINKTEKEESKPEKDDAARPAIVFVDKSAELQHQKESHGFIFLSDAVNDDGSPDKRYEPAYTDFEKMLEETGESTDFLS